MKWLVLLLIVSSCSIIPKETRKCLNAQEKVLKYCDLKPDTITVRDTVRIAEVTADSFYVFNDTGSIDTFYLEKDRLKVKVIRVNDTIQVYGTCDSIFIERLVSVPCPPPINAFEVFMWGVFKWVRTWWWILIITAIVGYVLHRVYQAYKPL